MLRRLMVGDDHSSTRFHGFGVEQCKETACFALVSQIISRGFLHSLLDSICNYDVVRPSRSRPILGLPCFGPQIFIPFWVASYYKTSCSVAIL